MQAFIQVPHLVITGSGGRVIPGSLSRYKANRMGAFRNTCNLTEILLFEPGKNYTFTFLTDETNLLTIANSSLINSQTLWAAWARHVR